MIDKPNIIITGATGFIGSHLLKQLLSVGNKIYAVTRDPEQSFNHPNLIWVSWETYKYKIPENETIHAVLNLATSYGKNIESEDDILKCNVKLPISLFKYSIKKGAKKIINTDTFLENQHMTTSI